MILDVGCGGRAQGDVNLDVKTPKQKPINFVKAHAYYLPFKKDSFTKTTCFHLLEHLEQPIKAVEEIRRVSKTFIVAVPFGFKDHLENRISKRRKSGHLHFFNYRDLRSLLTDAKIRFSFRFLRTTKWKDCYKLKNVVWEFWLLLPSELIAEVNKK